MEKRVSIRPYYLYELAAFYEVSVYSMRESLKKVPDLGERVGYKWNNKQVRKIFTHLDPPEAK